MTSKEIRNITLVGIVSALSSIIMMFEFPLPFIIPILKYDFSDIPALFIGFFCGPVEGIFTIFIKNFLNYLFRAGDPIGHFMAIISGLSFVLPASLVYKNTHTMKGAFLGLIAGLFSFIVIMVPVNYFIVTYIYSLPKGLDVWTYIKTCVIPFNSLKGIINIVLILIIYKKFSRVLRKYQEKK